MNIHFSVVLVFASIKMPRGKKCARGAAAAAASFVSPAALVVVTVVAAAALLAFFAQPEGPRTHARARRALGESSDLHSVGAVFNSSLFTSCTNASRDLVVGSNTYASQVLSFLVVGMITTTAPACNLSICERAVNSSFVNITYDDTVNVNVWLSGLPSIAGVAASMTNNTDIFGIWGGHGVRRDPANNEAVVVKITCLNSTNERVQMSNTSLSVTIIGSCVNSTTVTLFLNFCNMTEVFVVTVSSECAEHDSCHKHAHRETVFLTGGSRGKKKFSKEPDPKSPVSAAFLGNHTCSALIK